MRSRTLTLAIVSAIAIAVTFGPGPQPSSGQQGTRLPGCGCFVCGDMHVAAGRRGVNLPFNYLSLEDPNCVAGILAEDACPAVLAQMRKEKVEAFCQKIKDGLKFTSFKDSCPVLATACEPEEKKTECRQNPDSPNGKNCCDNMPERGSLYAGTLDGRIYSEPSSNSTVVGSPPSGTRLRYTNTTQVNGQTWYYIESPGRERKGWMSGSQLSCTRPVEPPAPKIVIDPIRMQLYQGRAAHAHAARG